MCEVCIFAPQAYTMLIVATRVTWTLHPTGHVKPEVDRMIYSVAWKAHVTMSQKQLSHSIAYYGIFDKTALESGGHFTPLAGIRVNEYSSQSIKNEFKMEASVSLNLVTVFMGHISAVLGSSC